MFKVPNGQNPYSTIGKYIRDNTTAIEDMIAVIEIDGVTTNELLLVNMHGDEYFVWKSDWWEGEKDIALIDFFPVSDAQKPSAFATDINVGDKDTISRRAVIEEIERWLGYIDDDMVRRMQIGMKRLPSAQPERIKARWILAENQRPEDMENDNYLFICSNCGSTDLHSKRVPVSYCWDCGAEMLREVTE